MSMIDDFLIAGNNETDALIGTRVMVCAGQTFPVVFNDVRKSYEGALGGLESDLQATVVAQPHAVENPVSMLQKRCTVGGDAFRIAEVAVGNVAITFTLASAGDSR
jgi:hypothetical protein